MAGQHRVGGEAVPDTGEMHLYSPPQRGFMLRGAFESAGEVTADSLRGDYEALLAETVRQRGVTTVAAETAVSAETLQALVDGNSVSLSLEAATEILSTDPDRPAAEVLEAEARDMLLMGMSAAVLDVEATAAALDNELDPRTIQQKIEGRAPLSLREYARLHSCIEAQTP